VLRTALEALTFRGTRGGPLSESIYGRFWHAALSLWLNSGGDPSHRHAKAGGTIRYQQL
jgi:hypothetical protein